MSIPGAASPLFLSAAAAGAAADHQIDRSLRFNSADSSYLNRTPSSAGNQKTFTFSCWVKISKLDAEKNIFVGSNNWFRFESSNEIYYWHNGSTNVHTDAKFRDPAAWQHLVLAVDTSQATASNRVKIYVNGVQQDLSGTQPSQDATLGFNGTYAHYLGSQGTSGSNAFNGYLAEIHNVDGSQLAASDFGKYDDNNVWQPKAYTGSYGTNGFYLKFADNSSTAALGTDSSGNSNTFTVNNLQAAAGAASDALTAVSFDGVDDKLTLGTDSNLSLSGVFTLEAWIYRVGTNNEVGIFEGSPGGVGSCVVRVASNMLGLERHNTAFDILSSGTVPTDQWVHVAITRDNQNTCRAFINGQHDGTSTNNTHQYTGDFRVGQTNNGYFESAVSNLRLIKGTCLYTSNFTPPTTPLSNVTNTVLLICQDSSSATAATVKPSGTTIGTGGSPTPGSYPIVGATEVDSLIDTPTNYSADSGNPGGNYCTMNPLLHVRLATLSNGNLDVTGGSFTDNGYGTIAVPSGKWYAEATVTGGGGASNIMLGVKDVGQTGSTDFGAVSRGYGYRNDAKRINSDNIDATYGATYTDGDTIGIALDLDAGTITFYKNGSSQGQAYSGISSSYSYHFCSFTRTTSDKVSWNFGQRPFKYTVPSNHLAVCTTNLPDPTIADGSTAFDVITATGTEADKTFTMPGGFGPDLVWAKQLNGETNHALFDTVRGATKRLVSNKTQAEDTQANQLKAFTSTGFTYGSDIPNGSSQTGVYWCWDGGTSTASNTDGSITSSVRANQSAGFSIVTYTDPASGSVQTVGHGLNAAPEFIIVKSRTGVTVWLTYHKSLGKDYYTRLDDTDASYNVSNIWGNAEPTSSVFGVKGDNQSNMVAYCFAPVEGYSAFGSYTGNGNADGTFVYTGFKIAYLVIRCTSHASMWSCWDTTRDVHNPAERRQKLDDDRTEESGDSNLYIDLLSNGFKTRVTDTDTNGSGRTYLYMAFAEHPFSTARAR